MPQYSEEARGVLAEGTVVLEAIIRKDGTITVENVREGVGFGLDQNAVQSVNQWRFSPAMRNGEPVDVAITLEVTFNLSDGPGLSGRRRNRECAGDR